MADEPTNTNVYTTKHLICPHLGSHTLAALLQVKYLQQRRLVICLKVGDLYQSGSH